MRIFIAMILILATTAFSALPGKARADGVPQPGIILYGKVTKDAQQIFSGQVTWTYTPPSGDPVVHTAFLRQISAGGDTYSYLARIPAEYQYGAFTLSDNALPAGASSVTYTRAATVSAAPATIVSPASTQDTFSWSECGVFERVDLTVTGTVVDLTSADVLNHLLGKGALSAQQSALADVNHDDRIDICDYLIMIANGQ